MVGPWGWKLWATVALFLGLAVAPLGYPLVARVVFICAAGVELLLAFTLHQIVAKTRAARSTVPKASAPSSNRES